MTDQEAKERSVTLNGREVEAVKMLMDKWYKLREIMEMPESWLLAYDKQINNIRRKIKETKPKDSFYKSYGCPCCGAPLDGANSCSCCGYGSK